MKDWIILNSRDCNLCGKSYEYDSRQKNAKYCSQSCRSLSYSQNKITGVEGLDFVICKICGLKFKEINNDHIKQHNITCDEYDNMFKSSRTSENTRKKKDTLSNLMNKEMSDKLSRSHTLDGYKEKYGEVDGLLLFNKMKENKIFKDILKMKISFKFKNTILTKSLFKIEKQLKVSIWAINQ
jgi:transcription elongation factor Elf1